MSGFIEVNGHVLIRKDQITALYKNNEGVAYVKTTDGSKWNIGTDNYEVVKKMLIGGADDE